MSSNSNRIIQQLQHDFKELIEYAIGEVHNHAQLTKWNSTCSGGCWP